MASIPYARRHAVLCAALLTLALPASLGCSMAERRGSVTRVGSKITESPERLTVKLRPRGRFLELEAKHVWEREVQSIETVSRGWQRGRWPLWELFTPDFDILISLGVVVASWFSDDLRIRGGLGGLGGWLLSTLPGVTCQWYGVEDEFESIEEVVATPGPVTRSTERRPFNGTLQLKELGAARATRVRDGRARLPIAPLAERALLAGLASLDLELRQTSGSSPLATASLGLDALVTGVTPALATRSLAARRSFWRSCEGAARGEALRALARARVAQLELGGDRR